MPPSLTSERYVKQARSQVRVYLRSLPPLARKTLRQLCAVIRSAAPGVEDSFSYGIPAFKLDGRPLLGYAAWKSHYSVYPVTAAVRRTAKLKGYDTAKGTLRMPFAKPLPVALVRQLVKDRISRLRKAAET